jgi:hypothetical protein
MRIGGLKKIATVAGIFTAIISLQSMAAVTNEFIARDGIPNVAAKLKHGKELSVVYFGGSITHMNGWRNNTDKWLRNKFPQSKISMTNAGLGGTGTE